MSVQQSQDPPFVLVGQAINLRIDIGNHGPGTAAGVVLTDTLPSHLSLVGFLIDRGSCTNDGSSIRCELGTMAEDDTAVLQIFVEAIATGQGVNHVEVQSDSLELNPADNVSDSGIPVVLPSLGFRNSAPITLAETGPGIPYPSTIEVSGLTNTLYKVNVLLSNMVHTFPDDMDLLLVAPGGELAMVFSDAGGANQLFDTSVLLDEDALEILPNNGQIFNGRRYQPRNHNTALDTMPPPAPWFGLPYPDRLEAFRNTNPNGVWSLYALDDVEFDSGSLEGGWALELFTMEPFTDLDVRMETALDRVGVGSNLVYSVTVSNAGPSVATSVLLTNLLPDEVSLASITASQGSCIQRESLVECSLGSLGVGATVSLELTVMANIAGLPLFQASAWADQADVNRTNNSASVATLVTPLVDLNLTVTPSSDSGVVEDLKTYTLVISNQSTIAADELVLYGAWPNSLLFQSVTASQGTCGGGPGQLSCELGALAPGSNVVVELILFFAKTNSVVIPWTVEALQVDSDWESNVRELAIEVLPVSELALSSNIFPETDLVTYELSILYRVLNLGPDLASGIHLSSWLPQDFLILAIKPGQGLCTNDQQGRITCELGQLAPHDMATVELIVAPQAVGLRTNHVEISAQQVDRNPGNNSIDTVLDVQPIVDLRLLSSPWPHSLPVGTNVVYPLMVTNVGPYTATAVTISNRLTPEAGVLSVTSSQGTCMAGTAGVTCELGLLAPGDQALITLNLETIQPGVLSLSTTVGASQFESVPFDNQILSTAQISRAEAPWMNTTPLLIPMEGTAELYPSTIVVSGMSDTEYRVSVTLHDLHHAFPGDLDMLLVSPGGNAVMVFSDVGGGVAVTNLTLNLSDSADTMLPGEGPLKSGQYLPTNRFPGNDQLPMPAPPPPYGTNLAALQSDNPNGLWSLYIYDNATPDSGGLEGGWSLNLETLQASADLALIQTAPPDPVALSSNLTLELVVTNRGPEVARDIVLTNDLPTGALLSAVTADAASCTASNGAVVCTLDRLDVGHASSVWLTFTLTQTGMFTHRADVAASSHDPEFSNNASTRSVEVLLSPSILADPVSRTVQEFADVTFAVTATGTEPLFYQWRRDGAPVPGATGSQLVLPNVRRHQAGDYAVRVTNQVGQILSATARLEVQKLQSIEPVVLQDQPLHYYRFEETNLAAPALDQGLAGDHPGTFQGGLLLDQDTLPMTLGRALHVSGSPGAFVDLGLFHVGDAVTLEAWIRLDQAADTNLAHAILSRWDGSFELGVSTAGRPRLLVRNELLQIGQVTGPVELSRDQWHHLVSVFAGGQLQLYVDGEMAANQPFGGVLRNGGSGPGTVLIGATADGTNSSLNWEGYLDEVAIYPGALPAERIAAHYLAGLPPIELTLTADGQLVWPAIPSELELQSSELLGEGASWMPDPAPRILEDGYYNAALPLGGPSRFYRLYLP